MRNENNKIELKSIEKLRYFRTTVILLIISILCLSETFSKLPFKDFNITENVNDKIGLIFLFLAIISYFFFEKRLEYKTKKVTYNKVIAKKLILEEIEKNENWNLYEKSQNVLVIETIGNSKNIGYSKNSLIAPGYGSRIYVGIFDNEYFVKSLSNFSKETIFNLNMGENKTNEAILKRVIKSTANNS